MLQFVALAGNNAVLVDSAVAVLQAPFYQGPDLPGYLHVATFQTIAAGTIGQHGSVATVEGTKHVITSADDAPRYELVLRVNELQIAPPCGHRALVAPVVA